MYSLSSHVDECSFPNAPGLTKFQVVFSIIAAFVAHLAAYLLFLLRLV